MSIDYYNQNAEQFAQDTLGVDMTPLYAHFLPHLTAGAHIVDAGCGSGRDSHYFRAQGFQVTPFDASAELAAAATAWLGMPVQLCRFEEFQAPEPVDAIWACASLLHVPLPELPQVLAHLAAQLREGGYFYCSFKYGTGAVERNGRSFTNLNEAMAAQLLHSLPLTLCELWLTGDQRPDRADERWLNLLLQKVSL